MSKDNDRLLGQLEAKLQELHQDVKEIRADVADLKADFIKRQTLYKLAIWFVSVFAGFIGWIANHLFVSR